MKYVEIRISFFCMFLNRFVRCGLSNRCGLGLLWFNIFSGVF